MQNFDDAKKKKKSDFLYFILHLVLFFFGSLRPLKWKLLVIACSNFSLNLVKTKCPLEYSPAKDTKAFSRLTFRELLY